MPKISAHENNQYERNDDRNYEDRRLTFLAFARRMCRSMLWIRQGSPPNQRLHREMPARVVSFDDIDSAHTIHPDRDTTAAIFFARYASAIYAVDLAAGSLPGCPPHVSREPA